MSELSIIITGGLQGIGAEIVERFAQEQSQIAIIANAKSIEASDLTKRFSEFRKMGSEVRVIPTNILDDAEIAQAVDKAAMQANGVIDVCVNAALLSQPMTYDETTPDKLDLFYQVNARSGYSLMRSVHQYLRKSHNPHVLNIAPPINLDPRVMGYRTAYTVSQYFRSMLTVGMANAEQWRGIACNALWPLKPFCDGGNLGIYQSHIDVSSELRRMALFSEAAYGIITQPADRFNGEFFYDEEILEMLSVPLGQFDEHAQPQSSEAVSGANFNHEDHSAHVAMMMD
ncbi:MAG: hypothetical protein CMF52_01360 [Legionellales bacterium]|nr:hypothetical protein [Legionellales bacterium]HAV93412.1 hypothetical protein [Pseudomonadota bacterium]|tara:strand:+ start:283 stop:1140 length:858 start_codon:yes stop_codon:yes gene_type:complete